MEQNLAFQHLHTPEEHDLFPSVLIIASIGSYMSQC